MKGLRLRYKIPIICGIVLVIVLILWFTFLIDTVTIEGNTYFSTTEVEKTYSQKWWQKNMLTYFVFDKLGIKTDPETCGVAGLAFLGGSYMAEAFRSGLEAVGKIQHESALSLGLTALQTFRYVILPQAFAISIPGITANVIFLLKETSVFSAISLMDLMFTAKDQIGLYYKTTECLVLLVVFYLLILLPVSLLGSLLERRVRHAEFGT